MSKSDAGRLPLLDKDLIEKGIADVRSRQTDLSPEEFDERVDRMLQRMGTSARERRRWVSGKHCLLPLAIRLLPRRPSPESFCFRLAERCTFLTWKSFETAFWP